MTNAEFLSTVDGFKGIDIQELESIAAGTEVRTFGPDDYLNRKGAPGDNKLVIMEGRVRVPIVGAGGREKMVFNLGKGDLVGEMALLTGEPRSADVIAETRVATLVMQREILEPLLAEYPELAGFLTEILGKRLEEDGGIQQVGKYRVLSKLGEGTTGKIYEALHVGLDRLVAMKMLSHSLVYNQKFRERFLNEARTIAGLLHPNIIQVFDTESAYATYFIIMEKLAGTDLERLLRERKSLNPPEALPILRQVASALAHAHKQGFAHRDVKPANVAIDETGRVKLMDFGIARTIPRKTHGQKSATVDGTPQYIAPESAMGHPPDGRVDIYALGVMAFEMVAGRLPFEEVSVRGLLKAHVRTPPPDIQVLRPDLPDGLCEFIRRTLIKDPAERLTDFNIIQRLLASDDSPPEVWTNAAEQIVRIRYVPSLASRVNAAVQGLVDELAEVDGVETACGCLQRPARSDPEEQ